MRACTLGKRHRWIFVKNVTMANSMGTGTVRIYQRGIYRCECGLHKYGIPGD